MRRVFVGFLLLFLTLPAAAQAGGINSLFGSEQPELLAVEQAFPFGAERVSPQRIVARWDTQQGYYLYRDKIRFELKDSVNRIERIETPPGEPKDDPYFGRLEVYHGPVSASVYLQRPAQDDLTLVAHYQGCADAGLCYPPQTVEIALAGGAANATATSSGSGGAGDGELLVGATERLTGVLEAGRPLPILAAFFVAGLLLAFTACLYPMIPILSGLVAGDRQRRTGLRAFLLSLVYVEAAAITYAAVGVIAGLTGSAVQADLQSPWVLGAFAAVFVAMALSMFGLYEVQLPSRWQTRIAGASRHQRGGTIAGVAIMGALSALIVGACSGPALIAALVFISATGNAWLGGLALFVLANGMGLPLLLIGTAAGKWLPRVGHWMVTVRRVVGVAFLAVALWMLERVLPASLALALWGALILGCGIFLGALDPLQQAEGGARRLRKAAGLVLLIWGVVALVGAFAGGRDLWRPLEHSTIAGSGLPPVSNDETFRTIAGVDELRMALREASAAGRPVLLDVYADWCVYCVELDEKTFTHARVRELLSRAVLLRADVTAMNAKDKALLQSIDVFLPPAVMFFDRQGEERRALRVVGFLGPEEFLPRARQALFGDTG